ncbi:ABC transporter substrate-binding protein [Pelagibacterium montanilacus]|uniref:ABC transporter substrate-binding protein n=1 Tax=Pelagibacterium montanilacus TaxID=2185280 RepID=UPI000F8E1751|nr:ABC transporter substrate-binding protein [Pelagibacterium montanilacus]
MHKTLLAGISAAAFALALTSAGTAQDVELPDLAGESFTVFGPWVGGVEIESFQAVVDDFNEKTGANAEYVGSDSLEQQIVIDAQAGSAPEVTFFPQPGLAANMAQQGFLTPLPEGSEEWVLENYAAGQSWVDLGTYANESGEDELYGFFYNVNLKSLVWYVPDNFADAGYEVPETMEDLIALSEQIVADGGTPWCIGIGSDAATGWPATDWVEDIMLRLHEPSVYDRWVSNDLAFDSPEVIEAIDTFGTFVKSEGWVAGGTQAVGTTDFRDSPAGLFQVPPQCYLHRQASFVSSFFPDGTELGTDADFFYFPAFAEKDLGNPVLGGGTLAAITNDTPGARAFMDYLKTPAAHEIWMATAGFLTPHLGADLAAYADDTLRAQGEILLGADAFGFDASDLMPGAIGAGAFWTGMVDFVGGASAEEVAADIQAAWDNL